MSPQLLEGIFSDVVGLAYRCDSTESTISDDSKYYYKEGCKVAFSIGDLVIGESIGKPFLTVSDLVPINIPTFDTKRVNRARLLYSLAPAQGFENPIAINQRVRDIVSKHASEIDLDSPDPSNLDGPLSRICIDLGHFPKTVAHTRNHLRRDAAGFKVLRDITIPTQDGEPILADVYLPLESHKKYPVLVSCTIYGRRVFYSGPDLESPEEIAEFEKAEDDWHSTPEGVPIKVPRKSWGRQWEAQRGFENIATFNTFTYVPQGYAMVKVDPKGVSQTPGTRGVPGQLAGEFYDAVEWAASQPWSNGNVAMVGSSYGANTQWSVAGLCPKGLKCFVPYATDIDPYREALYTGGIPTINYLTDWYSRVGACSPKWNDQLNLVEIMKTHPFYDGLWDMVSEKRNASNIPCFLAASQIFMIHGRGAYEAWRTRNPENTFLQLVDCDYYSWPSREASNKIIQFLDHYLKEKDTPAPEKVGIQVRLGNGEWYWRKENTWPVPGIQYTKWHLTTVGTLSTNEDHGPATKFKYSTKIPDNGKSGVSFHSPPFDEDVEFAGHFSATLNISSSASDADFVVMLWPVEDGKVVPFGGSSGKKEPLAKGFLRASHRKLNPEKTLPERPWHTHVEQDNLPLTPGDVVQIEVELYPAAGRIRKSWRLRLDITPSEHQPDIPGYKAPEMRTTWGEMHGEASNTIHVGDSLANFVLCPVVPLQQGYPNLVL